jgi:hypothetical protein
MMDMHENKEMELAIQQLRYRNLIVKKELSGFVGTTIDGLTIWFPDSLQRGWTHELTPVNERPHMIWEIAGLVGYFSDGHLNYLPRYNQGREMAREAKMNLIANQTWNLTEENKELKKSLQSLKDEINKLKEKKDS